YGFYFFLNEYAGNMKEFLDNTCSKLNESWPSTERQIEDAALEFRSAFSASQEIFGPANVGHKWINGAYERRLNRAILDVQLYFFSNSQVRADALAKAPAVRAAFNDLCDKDTSFRSSVESTTKSLTATAQRLRLWGSALSRTLDTEFGIPNLQRF